LGPGFASQRGRALGLEAEPGYCGSQSSRGTDLEKIPPALASIFVVHETSWTIIFQ
jgi:hypothetical protein